MQGFNKTKQPKADSKATEVDAADTCKVLGKTQDLGALDALQHGDRMLSVVGPQDLNTLSVWRTVNPRCLLTATAIVSITVLLAGNPAPPSQLCTSSPWHRVQTQEAPDCQQSKEQGLGNNGPGSKPRPTP